MEIIIKCSDDVRGGTNIYGEPIRELVRCKECKRRYRSGYRGDEYWVCDFMDAKIKDDDFCSYGSRSEKPNNCELQTIRCPKCGRTDYIRDMEKDMGIKDSHYKYKCINCNFYIKTEPTISKMEQVEDEPQTEPLHTCSVNGRPYSECSSCEHFKCTADEPQTERSE